MVWPTTTEAPPPIVIDVSTGAATVTVSVAVTPPDDAVMMAVPAVTPVMRPELFTEATALAFDDHVTVAAIAAPFWSFVVAVSCRVVPATRVEPPLIVIEVRTGTAVTVIVVLAVTLPTADVIMADPGATPVTTPVLLTPAMPGALVDHVTVAAMAFPFWSLGLAISTIVEPTATVVPPVNEIVVSTGVGGGVVGVSFPPPEQLTMTAASATTTVDRLIVNM